MSDQPFTTRGSLTAYSDAWSALKRLERLVETCHQKGEIAAMQESTRALVALCDTLSRHLYPDDQ
jgi:hypothetical protein